jgi:hypothetical protein
VQFQAANQQIYKQEIQQNTINLKLEFNGMILSPSRRCTFGETTTISMDSYHGLYLDAFETNTRAIIHEGAYAVNAAMTHSTESLDRVASD